MQPLVATDARGGGVGERGYMGVGVRAERVGSGWAGGSVGGLRGASLTSYRKSRSHGDYMHTYMHTYLSTRKLVLTSILAIQSTVSFSKRAHQCFG